MGMNWLVEGQRGKVEFCEIARGIGYLKARTRVVRALEDVNIFNCHDSAAVRTIDVIHS